MSQQLSSNFDLYKVFMYVAKYKSLTKAAAELKVSQPAISQSMKQLEANLGVKLTQRTGHGIKLTPEGELLFPYVKKGCEAFAHGEKALEKHLVEVAENVNDERNMPLESEPKTITDCFISGTQYSHFTGQKLPYRLLEHLPIILTKNDGTRDNLERFLRENDIKIVPAAECDTQDEVLKRVIGNDGIGCVTLDYAKKAIACGDAYILEFEKTLPIRREKTLGN